MTLNTEQKKNRDILINEIINSGINNPFTIAAILALAEKESTLIPQSENLKYSKERLPEVWGVFSKTGQRVPTGQGKYNYNDLAVEYAGNPMKLANYIYGGKNGNNTTGDGFLYRGRGYNQLTWKNNYKIFGDLIGVNLLDYPELANKPENASKIIIEFLKLGAKVNKFDLNGFNSLEDAVKYIYRVNAGWGFGFPTTQQGYVRMTKNAPEFLDYIKKKSNEMETPEKKDNTMIILFVIVVILIGIFYKKLKK